MKQTGVRTIFLVGFFLLCSEAKAQSDGYLSSLSVAQGEKLRFYISTDKPKFDLAIYKLGVVKKEVITLRDIPGEIQAVTDSAFINGCNWKISKEIVIPYSWSSGVYEADLPSADTVKKLIFVVREKTLGAHSKTLVCLTANTWQAYNNWGGRSLYDFNSYSQTASLKVSFNRPFSDETGYDYFRWANKLLLWLEEHHFEAEFCVNTDLDRDPFFLSHYKVYVTVGHDEYWSKPERTSAETFIRYGGRIICLSGNTCWWQVRFEDDRRTMVCFRDPKIDPLYQKQDSLVTSNWSREPINNPPNSLLGVSFEHGGFINEEGIFPKLLGYGGYTVFNSHHWMYNGTGVKDGDVIGAYDAIAGYEADGALYDWQGGIPVVTGEDKTPKNFSILGISPAATAANMLGGHATMGCYTTTSGGAVFNGASTDWVSGLDGDDSVQSQMLFNIFWRFTSWYDLPPEITSYSPVRMTRDSINHEWVNVNHLSMSLVTDRADTFTIHGRGPTGKRPFYFWKVAGKNLGFDSIFVLTPQMKKALPSRFLLEGCASIGYDKAIVSWSLLDTMMRIVSSPPTIEYKTHGYFYHKVVAASLIDGHPVYQLIYGPSWIHLDSRGNLSGSIGSQTGLQTVIIRAHDHAGNYDLQTFSIHVADSVQAEVIMPSAIANLRCFPNPATESIHFLIGLEETAKITIEIADLKGVVVRSIYFPGALPKGPETLEWDLTDDSGRRICSGVYLCKLHISASSGQTASVIEKIVVM